MTLDVEHFQQIDEITKLREQFMMVYDNVS